MELAKRIEQLFKDKCNEFKEEYVVLMDSDFVLNIDIADVIKVHEKTNANITIVTKIAGEVAKWGISMTSVDIQTITMSKDAQAAMLQEMEAERRARAIRHETQGKAAAIQMEAEAHRKALQMKAEAQKAYLEELASIIGQEGALQVLLSQQALDGYKIISETEDSTVYLPSNMMTALNINN